MPLKVSPSLHEDTVLHVGGNDAIVTALADAVSFARTQATSIAHIDELTLADKTIPREAGLLQVAEAASRSARAVAARLDAARTKAQTEISLLVSRISTPPAPKDHVAIALESDIRRRLAELPEKDRDAVVEEAFTSKNQAVLGAILRGPAFLTGMGQARHTMLRSQYGRAFHEAEAARVERLAKAVEAADRAGNLFVQFTREATDSPGTRLAAAAKQMREEALAAHQGV